LNIKVSQGSVGTRSRCNDILMRSFR